MKNNYDRDLVKLIAQGSLQMRDYSSVASLIVGDRPRHTFPCKRSVSLLHLFH